MNLTLLTVLCLSIMAQSALTSRARLQTRLLTTAAQACPAGTQGHAPWKPVVVQGDSGTKYEIKDVWWRHNKDYTQGFKMLPNGSILESTGLNGKSRIQLLKFDSCKHHVVRSRHTKKNPDSIFGEGADLIKLANGVEYIFQLTWKSRKIFVYDHPDLN